MKQIIYSKSEKGRQKILAAIAKNPNSTYRDLMTATGIKSLSHVYYYVDDLISRKLIRRNNRYTVPALAKQRARGGGL